MYFTCFTIEKKYYNVNFNRMCFFLCKLTLTKKGTRIDQLGDYSTWSVEGEQGHFNLFTARFPNCKRNC